MCVQTQLYYTLYALTFQSSVGEARLKLVWIHTLYSKQTTNVWPSRDEFTPIKINLNKKPQQAN